jgi:general stress protein YciG
MRNDDLVMPPKQRKGFAAMPKEKALAAQRKGGLRTAELHPRTPKPQRPPRQRTLEELSEMGRRGGQASVASRRALVEEVERLRVENAELRAEGNDNV